MYPDGTTSLNYAATGFKNVLINGDLRVWQRNPSGSLTAIGSSTEYLGPDRWAFTGVSTGVVRFSRNDASNGLKTVNFNVAGTTNPVAMQQYIEAQNLVYGQQYTFSFYSTADFPAASLTSYDSAGTAKDLNPSADKWSATSLGNDRWSVTFTYTTANGEMNSPDDKGLNCYLGCNGLTYPADGNYQFWNIQLEPGPTASDFEIRPIGAELNLCLRYFYKYEVTLNSTLFSCAQTSNSNTIEAGSRTSWWHNLNFPVIMRIPPIGLGYTNLVANNYIAIPGYRAITAAIPDSDVNSTSTISSSTLFFNADVGGYPISQGSTYTMEAGFSYDFSAEL
jgi:hypothetical protein